MTLDDVAQIASGLPEVTEGEGRSDTRTWGVADKTFAWERWMTAGWRAHLRVSPRSSSRAPVRAGRRDGSVQLTSLCLESA
ncbi:MAG: hypothetical protein ACHQIG_06740 [Acidimicrobiia bacterium]